MSCHVISASYKGQTKPNLPLRDHATNRGEQAVLSAVWFPYQTQHFLLMLFNATVEKPDEIFAKVLNFCLVEAVLQDLLEVSWLWYFRVFVVNKCPGRFFPVVYLRRTFAN